MSRVRLFALQAAREQDLRARFDYALWMDSDNHLVADCCEDLLGTLVALRHGWAYTAGNSARRPRAAHNRTHAMVALNVA